MNLQGSTGHRRFGVVWICILPHPGSTFRLRVIEGWRCPLSDFPRHWSVSSWGDNCGEILMWPQRQRKRCSLSDHDLIPLMEEILHRLIGSLFHYFLGVCTFQVVQDFFHQQYHKLNQMTTCDDSFECLLECLFVKGMECLCDLSYQLAVPSRSSLSCEGPMSNRCGDCKAEDEVEWSLKILTWNEASIVAKCFNLWGSLDMLRSWALQLPMRRNGPGRLEMDGNHRLVGPVGKCSHNVRKVDSNLQISRLCRY